ncbi:hypothetical protein [Arthrobacter sp. USHLN218]|uniref:hypothetical protein n=1 Tax=Arthrobacter sp. USHLN218 TaxID=3081232 RepID=UPI00301A9B5E
MLTWEAFAMLESFLVQIDAQNLANLIQIVLIIVTVVGIMTALINGKKDRRTAMKLAAADRRAADERADRDRHAADKRAMSDRQHAREQAQQQFRTQQAIRLTQLIYAGRPDNPSQQTAWMVEIQSLLYALGEEDLPLTWAEFISPGISSTAGEGNSRNEVANFVRQVGMEMNCSSCFHNH